MRILFVTEQFPYPLDNGGNVRTFNLMRGLASAHELTLIALAPAHAGESDLEAVARLCREVRLVPSVRRGKLREAWRLCSSMRKGESFVLERHRAASFGAQIARVLSHPARKASYDVVHFNHLDTAIYESLVPAGTLRVLDEHNVVCNQVATTAGTEHRTLRRAVLRREHRRLRSIEARLCDRMDYCLVCSDPDAQSLRALGVESPLAVVPNGVDLTGFTPVEGPHRGNDVVFVGALDYDPCEKGVWFFCTQILQRLRRYVPDVRFVAVGRNPSLRLRRLAASDEGIVLTGRVDDVRPFVRAASVSVAPLLSGSGTRLKILESLAAGTPVVTTTMGVEGIKAVSGEHLLVADEPEAFALAVRSIIADESLAGRLRRQGRELVESEYGWPPICDRLLEVYEELSRSAGREARHVGR